MSSEPPGKMDNQFGRSNQAEHYLKYRPSYPEDFVAEVLEDFLFRTALKSQDGLLTAVELACGSGQLTKPILKHFDHVVAVDFCGPQLENLAKDLSAEISSQKLSVLNFDCSLIDELLELPEIQARSPTFVLIGQAFHWFDYDDFLTRFAKATKGKNVHLVLFSYPMFNLHSNDLRHEEAVQDFVATTGPYFKCNRKSLENEYREFNFSKYFNHVSFHRLHQPVPNCPIQAFLGYLNTWSAYRNFLEENGNTSDHDPLMLLMDKLGVKNDKNFASAAISENGCHAITYSSRFFAYVMY